MSGQFKQYTLGRGRLYWALATVDGAAPVAGSPERYLGNSPALSLTSATTKLDHFDSDAGIKVKDDSIVLQFDRTGKLSLDSMDVENMALYFIAISQKYAQAAVVAGTQDIVFTKGQYIQLGVSVNATGLRNLSNLVVTNKTTPATVYVAGTDYVLDPVSGRINFPTGTAVADGTVAVATFDAAANTRVQMQAASSVSLFGSLRYVANNPKGTQYDFFWPYVELSADGDFTMKGDTWQQMNFNMDILDPGDGRKSFYIDGIPQLVV